MDEKGIQLGGGWKKGQKKYFFIKSWKQWYKICSDNLELVMVLECINAAGSSALTFFVLSSGCFPDILGVMGVGLCVFSLYIYSLLYSRVIIGISESGWMDCQFAAEWIVKVFIPAGHDVAVDVTKPILLFIDGHDSHECLDIKAAVYRNKGNLTIIVIAFPSKTTHKCQPLDAVIFVQTQAQWSVQCLELTDKNIPMTCYNVIHEFMEVRKDFMTVPLIQKSFCVTGIYPFNPNIFTEEDFTPSQVFSVKAHTPASFPETIPSSDPAIPTNSAYNSGIYSGDVA